jgi:YD repeat-containing protein
MPHLATRLFIASLLSLYALFVPCMAQAQQQSPPIWDREGVPPVNKQASDKKIISHQAGSEAKWERYGSANEEFVGSSVFADSWALPTPKQYYSANNRFYIEVIPRKLASQSRYFKDKVDRKEPAGSPQGEKDNYCKGIFYRQTDDGKYEKVWVAPLSNDVAPVSALVSDGGQYVVTFDNWHAVGYGDNVVVIYGSDGKIIRKLALTDIVPAESLSTLPRSVSSIWWGGHHYLDEARGLLVLQVVKNGGRAFNEGAEYREVGIELKTGALSDLTINAPKKSDRALRGYCDGVQSVQTESANRSTEDSREDKRTIKSIEHFERDGRLLEDTYLKDDGSILWADKKSYDAQGRLIGTSTAHDRFVYLPDRQTYKYDDKGNLVEENGYDSSGKLVNKDEYVYDEQNRRIQWTSISYHPAEHSRPHRWTYSYDDYGRLKEEQAFSDEGSGFTATDSLGGPHKKIFLYKSTDNPETTLSFKADGTYAGLTSTTYDDRGNPTEEIEYRANGSVKSRTRYTYKYDPCGNWTRRDTYEWIERGIGGLYQPVEVSYQIIKMFEIGQ